MQLIHINYYIPVYISGSQLPHYGFLVNKTHILQMYNFCMLTHCCQDIHTCHILLTLLVFTCLTCLSSFLFSFFGKKCYKYCKYNCNLNVNNNNNNINSIRRKHFSEHLGKMKSS